jgi:hypothetical protein
MCCGPWNSVLCRSITVSTSAVSYVYLITVFTQYQLDIKWYVWNCYYRRNNKLSLSRMNLDAEKTNIIKRVCSGLSRRHIHQIFCATRNTETSRSWRLLLFVSPFTIVTTLSDARHRVVDVSMRSPSFCTIPVSLSPLKIPRGRWSLHKFSLNDVKGVGNRGWLTG